MPLYTGVLVAQPFTELRGEDGKALKKLEQIDGRKSEILVYEGLGLTRDDLLRVLPDEGYTEDRSSTHDWLNNQTINISIAMLAALKPGIFAYTTQHLQTENTLLRIS